MNSKASSTTAMAEHQAYTVSNTRDILVSYAGGSHGLHSGLRRGILEWCAESSDSECKVHDCTQKGDCVNNFAILATYARSVFCLQPDGDTPTRQGWFDALLSGCIPVFFSTCLRPVKANSNLYNNTLPRLNLGSGWGSCWRDTVTHVLYFILTCVRNADGVIVLQAKPLLRTCVCTVLASL